MANPHMDKKDFRTRMLEEIDRRGITLAELSRLSGVSYDALTKLKQRPGSSTSAENALRIFDALEGYHKSEEPIIPAKTEKGAGLVPVYDVAASAGHGTMIEYEAIAYSLAFPPNYLRKLTSGNPRNLAIISVKGESMEPTLNDDDIVMLDTSKTSLSYDGLFVLRFGDALHVKRVGRASKKDHIMVISDNRSVYPPQEMAVTEIEPIGKVIWYGRKV